MPTNHLAIVAPPVPGHYDPLRVLARALERRDFRVTFVHMLDAAVLTQDLGFEAVGTRTHGRGALKRYTDILARAGRPSGFFEMIRATAAITRMLLDELPAALQRIGADAVIADSTEAAGGLVARKLELPWATSVTGLPLLRETTVPPPFTGWSYDASAGGVRRNAVGYRIADWLSRPIARELERAGQRWRLDPYDHQGFSPWLQVAQCPAALDFPRQRLPDAFHYCGPWRESGAAPFLRADKPLVYCSLGSLQGDRPKLFAELTQACADLGARAVVAHGGRLSAADAARLPGDPIVAAFWHQPATLPHCSAAILHAGFNTVLDALAAGLPMLVSPIAFEQPGTAARVEHHGAGRILRSRRHLRRDLADILETPSYRTSSRLIGAQMSHLGGVEEAADRIEQLFRPAIADTPASATKELPGKGDARDDSLRSGSR